MSNSGENMEQRSSDGGEKATLNRVLELFKELRRNSEWAQLHLETTMTGELTVNLSVRCSGAISSSGVRKPRTGGGVASARTNRTSPSRTRRNYRRRQEFLSRKNSTEKASASNIRVDETRSRDIMDPEIVDNPEVAAVDTPAEECIWRQNEADDSDTSSGKGTLLENEDGSETVRVKIHGEFLVNESLVNPETVFESKECFEEIRDDFLQYYKIEITSLEFLSSEPCNLGCRFGENCPTVTSVKMKMKPGMNKFPDNELTFGEMKTLRVAFPSLGFIS